MCNVETAYDGAISAASQEVYDQTVHKLPDFNRAVKEIESMDFSENPVTVSSNKAPSYKKTDAGQKALYRPNILIRMIMWILAVGVIFYGICIVLVGGFMTGVVWIIAGLIMCPKTNKTMKFLPRLGLMFLLLFISCFLV